MTTASRRQSCLGNEMFIDAIDDAGRAISFPMQ